MVAAVAAMVAVAAVASSRPLGGIRVFLPATAPPSSGTNSCKSLTLKKPDSLAPCRPPMQRWCFLTREPGKALTRWPMRRTRSTRPSHHVELVKTLSGQGVHVECNTLLFCSQRDCTGLEVPLANMMTWAFFAAVVSASMSGWMCARAPKPVSLTEPHSQPTGPNELPHEAAGQLCLSQRDGLAG